MTTPTQLDEILNRARHAWHNDASHTEIEQTYQDRTFLANQVQRMRLSISGYLDRINDMERDFETLRSEAVRMAEQLQRVEAQTHVLAGMHWVEIEPGEFVNPTRIEVIREIGPGPEGEPRCQVLTAMSGVTVNRSAAATVQMLLGGVGSAA